MGPSVGRDAGLPSLGTQGLPAGSAGAEQRGFGLLAGAGAAFVTCSRI